MGATSSPSAVTLLGGRLVIVDRGRGPGGWPTIPASRGPLRQDGGGARRDAHHRQSPDIARDIPTLSHFTVVGDIVPSAGCRGRAQRALGDGFR
jgi:hypothetical protein